jgi:hypothetical protein
VCTSGFAVREGIRCIEIAIRIQSQYRLAQKSFELPKILIDFRELFSRVGEKIFDVELRMALAHMHCEGRAIASTGQSQDMLLIYHQDIALFLRSSASENPF